MMVLLCACSSTNRLDKDDPLTTGFLQKHLTVIASAEMEGRNTPSPGLDKAANYIEAHFKKWGLKKVNGSYRQWYPLHKDSMVNAEFSINGHKAVYGVDYLIDARSNANAKLNADMVFAGYGIEDIGYNDLKNISVAGKIAVFCLGEPKSDGRFLANNDSSSKWIINGLKKKLDLLKSKGAVGAVVLNPATTSFTTQQVSNGKASNFYYPDTASAQLPTILISRDHAIKSFGAEMEGIYSKASAGKPFGAVEIKTLDAKAKVEFQKELIVQQVSNVIGIVEGNSKKGEYVVLTAHYDHLGIRDGKIYYGADDDGSGTVAVMSLAKFYADASRAGNKPERTLVFLAVSGEEKGLWGSRYYSDNPLLPLEKTNLNLNIDMIGRVDTERNRADSNNYVYIVGSDKISTELPALVSRNNISPALVSDFKFDAPDDVNQIYFRSDHYNFARKGVPVLFFYDGMLKADYHKPTDTVDKISWDLYLKRLQYIKNILSDAANSSNMLKRDLPIPTRKRARN